MSYVNIVLALFSKIKYFQKLPQNFPPVQLFGLRKNSTKTYRFKLCMVISPCCINVASSTSIFDSSTNNKIMSSSSPVVKSSTTISSPSSSTKLIRSEDELGRKLERCAADSLLKIGGGLAVGIIFSVLLFKRRTMPIWFGTGTGLGMGYSNCQHDLREPFLLHGKKVKATEVQGKMQPSDYLVVVEKSASK